MRVNQNVFLFAGYIGLYVLDAIVASVFPQDLQSLFSHLSEEVQREEKAQHVNGESTACTIRRRDLVMPANLVALEYSFHRGFFEAGKSGNMVLMSE